MTNSVNNETLVDELMELSVIFTDMLGKYPHQKFEEKIMKSSVSEEAQIIALQIVEDERNNQNYVDRSYFRAAGIAARLQVEAVRLDL